VNVEPKPKRMPLELDPHLYRVCRISQELEGKLNIQLFEQLASFLPCQQQTLKARFKRLESNAAKMSELGAQESQALEKLAERIAVVLKQEHVKEANSQDPLLSYPDDPETIDFFYQALQAKTLLMRAHNVQRRLNGEEQLEDISNQIKRDIVKLASSKWPPNVMDPNRLQVWFQQRKKELKAKENDNEDSVGDAKDKKSVTERRKSKPKK